MLRAFRRHKTSEGAEGLVSNRRIDDNDHDDSDRNIHTTTTTKTTTTTVKKAVGMEKRRLSCRERWVVWLNLPQSKKHQLAKKAASSDENLKKLSQPRSLLRSSLSGPSSPLAPALFDMVNDMPFSQRELDSLRLDFEILKRQKDQVATEILARIGDEFSHDKIYPKSNRSIQPGKWSSLGLGIILLSGYERVLSRLDKPNHLANFLKQLVRHHCKRKWATPIEMRWLVAISRQVIMPFICQCRQLPHQQTSLLDDDGDDNGGSNGVGCDADDGMAKCEIHTVWSKFFLLLIGLISTAEIEVEQELEDLNDCSSI